MPAPSGVKLRDSCDACASSKVKCSKEKPNCYRCSERGLICQYLVTQKTGRKQRRRDTRSENGESAASGQDVVRPLSSESHYSPQSDPAVARLDPTTAQLDAASGFSIFDSPFSSLEGSTGFDSSLEDFISSLPIGPSISPLTPAPTLSTLPTSPEYAPENFGASTSALNNQVDTAFQSNKSSLPSSCTEGLEIGISALTGTFRSAEAFQQPSHAQSTDGLELAMRLMAQLSTQDEASSFASTLSTAPDSQLQAILDKNKKVMETVSSMLQSANSQDGYCLVIICLIISKVLSTYAAAAHGSYTRSDSHNRRSISSTTVSAWASTAESLSSGTTNHRTDPVAVQGVLRELYQVQISVDQLGSKMQQLCTKRSRAFDTDEFSTNGAMGLPALPFSATLMEQLYAELRKRVSGLSLELLDELKRYWT